MFKTRKREVLNFDTPQEMYDDYKNRKINGIQDYQSKMIDFYMEKGFDKKDVALELPTGTGKTLIGLLIGEFRRRKNKERVVFVCPTIQLVYQTSNYANEQYGIKVIPFTGSKNNYEAADKLKYTTAQNIAITNYSSVFNIKSFFDGADVLIFDDAHSGENYISSNWTVTINRKDLAEAYWGLIEILSNVLSNEQYNLLTKEIPKTEDYSWCDMIHNAKLLDKYLNIQELLDEKIAESNQKYSWLNIRNNLYACNVYISWEAIIIRPYIAPSLTNNAFANAKARIYMSATLGESGELERAYGMESIYRLPMVKDWKNKDIGRRFFMFPLASFNKKDSANIMCKIARKVNRGLIIVNDSKSQNGIERIFKENKITKTFNGKDIERSKEDFVNTDRAFAVIANRFDGIDFPNDECRMLILFNLPAVAHIQEKFMITRLAARVLFDERIRTRIIQALGRCTRSQTDYAAICILGEEIMSTLLSPKNIEMFNPELQAELQFGQDNSIDQVDIDTYLNMLDVFLEHGDSWDEAEEGIISIRDDIIINGNVEKNIAYEQLGNSVKYEVKFQYDLWKKDYIAAMDNIDNILRVLQEKDLKGYRGYWNYVGGCCAFALYKEGKVVYETKYKEYLKKASESTIAVNWFNYTEELGESKTNSLMEDILIRIEKVLIKEGGKGLKKFYDYLDNILLLLNSNGKDFERGHELLGYLGGYISTNPKGSAEPDPIWIINRNLCIVSEDKIYEEGKLIPPNDVKEAAGHEAWVRNKSEKLDLSKEANVITIFITTACAAQENSVIYGENIFYCKKDELVQWAEKLISVMKHIFRTFDGEGNAMWREEVIRLFSEYNLSPEDYIEMVTKMKLKDI